MKCPKCNSIKLKEIRGGYGGCCTDEIRYGRSMDCTHNGMKCLKCKFMFFFGGEFEEYGKNAT